mmetsp:Transcript_15034/g.26635  ORF Transcript_15034/g.26635 Transcript_15034/m.26635 type:complete len:254 (+) Transcript_15034:1197-1958(+)
MLVKKFMAAMAKASWPAFKDTRMSTCHTDVANPPKYGSSSSSSCCTKKSAASQADPRAASRTDARSGSDSANKGELKLRMASSWDIHQGNCSSIKGVMPMKLREWKIWKVKSYEQMMCLRDATSPASWAVGRAVERRCEASKSTGRKSCWEWSSSATNLLLLEDWPRYRWKIPLAMRRITTMEGKAWAAAAALSLAANSRRRLGHFKGKSQAQMRVRASFNWACTKGTAEITRSGRISLIPAFSLSGIGSKPP